jgi:hypothetical protein
MCERHIQAIHCQRCATQFAWRAHGPVQQCRGFVEWCGCDGTVLPRWEHVVESVCYDCLMAHFRGELWWCDAAAAAAAADAGAAGCPPVLVLVNPSC